MIADASVLVTQGPSAVGYDLSPGKHCSQLHPLVWYLWSPEERDAARPAAEPSLRNAHRADAGIDTDAEGLARLGEIPMNDPSPVAIGLSSPREEAP